MLASGKAVIAMAEKETEVGCVVGEIGWLVPPGDAVVLAERIRAVAAQPGERERKGKLGRKYAQQCWDRERVLRDFLTHLEDMVVESSNTKIR
jgi:colanic acid biosynthesis glycosyl transferase WcaI